MSSPHRQAAARPAAGQGPAGMRPWPGRPWDGRDGNRKTWDAWTLFFERAGRPCVLYPHEEPALRFHKGGRGNNDLVQEVQFRSAFLEKQEKTEAPGTRFGKDVSCFVLPVLFPLVPCTDSGPDARAGRPPAPMPSPAGCGQGRGHGRGRPLLRLRPCRARG